jgi:hypothetical protein
MLRAAASRRILVLAAAATVGTGVGLGALSLLPASGSTPSRTTSAPVFDPSSPQPADPDTPDSSTNAAPARPGQLTLDQAKAVALRFSPGRVVEFDQDTEDTGLQYDVTVLHTDRTATDVVVDGTTGRVISSEQDDNYDGN